MPWRYDSLYVVSWALTMSSLIPVSDVFLQAIRNGHHQVIHSVAFDQPGQEGPGLAAVFVSKELPDFFDRDAALEVNVSVFH